MLSKRTNRQLFLDKPEGTTITTSATQNSPIQGETVTLTCTVTAAKPLLLEYRFYLNDSDKAINSLTNVDQYTIHDVQRSRDYGEYKCVASNSAGNGTDTVVLDIKGKRFALHSSLCASMAHLFVTRYFLFFYLYFFVSWPNISCSNLTLCK